MWLLMISGLAILIAILLGITAAMVIWKSK